MRSSRLFRRLLTIHAVVSGAVVLLLAMAWLAWHRQSDHAVRRAHLRTVAELLSAELTDEQAASRFTTLPLEQAAERWAERAGVTIAIVDTQGAVLANSAGDQDFPASLATRPEVREALRGAAPGEDLRWNPARRRDEHHIALPLVADGQTIGVLRVTGAVEQGTGGRAALAALGFGFLLWSIGMAGAYVWLGRAFLPLEQLARRSRALAAGEASTEFAYHEDDEIGQLNAAIVDMSVKRAGGLVQLREKSDLLTTVLGNMVEGVIAVAPDETVLIANAASGRMLGFAAESAVGRALFEVTRNQHLHNAVRESFRSRKVVNLEFDAPGSTRRIVYVRAAPLTSEPRAGVMIVMHDVTELRRLENLRREFVANVSHELKTPLASVKAYAETLRLGAIEDAEHRLEFVCRIEEQADRLHGLIVDLLHLARVEAGQEAFELVEIPLAAAVEECLEQFAPVAAARHMRLYRDASDESLTVVADEEGLNTILKNLIDNALKYTPEGGEVAVGWSREEPFGLIWVRDNGIGIAPRDQQRVFERFFRVDKARSRELGGTGLGLSIVKHLAQAFGGDVGLTSQPGAGSTFTVRLPLARRPLTEKHAEAIGKQSVT